MSYSNPSYLPAQRQVQTPWLDFTKLPDVDLVPVDPQVTSIDLSSGLQTAQVARGSVVSDGDGQRQGTVLFQPSTHATVVMPNGSQQPLTSLHVRATEFTVGPNGPNAMPAELPSNTGYTYAVDLSADEAVVAGATSVQFDQPVPYHVENFLRWPVGTIAPSGYYDQVQSQWVPAKNGLVIGVLSVTNGLADLDVDGTGHPATAPALAAMGVTDTERQQLASLYQPGQTLWRVPLGHLTWWDINQSTRPKKPADPPPPPCGPATPSPTATTTHSCSPAPPLPDCVEAKKNGSIIYCERQTLGESLPIAGTPFNPVYTSDRMPGRKDGSSFPIVLSRDTVSPSLARIDLEISVAGQLIERSFPATPNQSFTFAWDGKDAYGRPVPGSAGLTVRVGYVYPAVYMTPADRPGSNYDSLFGHMTYDGIPITSDPARAQLTLWSQTYVLSVLSPLNSGDVAGWSVDVHHIYDPNSRTLFMGDGTQRSASALNFNIITTRLKGTASRVTSGTATAADGSVYVVSGGTSTGVSTGIVQRISASGTLRPSRVAVPVAHSKPTLSATDVWPRRPRPGRPMAPTRWLLDPTAACTSSRHAARVSAA